MDWVCYCEGCGEVSWGGLRGVVKLRILDVMIRFKGWLWMRRNGRKGYGRRVLKIERLGCWMEWFLGVRVD